MSRSPSDVTGRTAFSPDPHAGPGLLCIQTSPGLLGAKADGTPQSSRRSGHVRLGWSGPFCDLEVAP